MRKLLALLALSILSGCASVADAGRLAEVEIVSRASGQKLETWRHGGRLYVAGTPGERYALRLANRSGGRLLTVLSVDGVNAVSGETAAARQSGYVLGPWQSAEIRGWRKSLDDVAAFYFTALPDAYAARTGRPDNVGVIGIAVFRERQVRPVYSPLPAPPIASGRAREQASAKAAAPAADSAMAEAAPQRLGTGHGQREWAPVGQTDFVRATRSPQQLSQLRYDDADTLVAIGVLPRWHPPHARSAPRAFPNGFVQDPPYAR